MSFINPTLPLAEMNKKIFAEIDRCNTCGREDVLKKKKKKSVSVCGTRELLGCVAYLMLIFVISQS